MHMLDELCDGDRACIIACSDAVAGQAGQLVDEGDEGLEVFLDGEVEGVAVF